MEIGLSEILIPLVGVIVRVLSNRRVLEHQEATAGALEKYNKALGEIAELKETCATCIHREDI